MAFCKNCGSQMADGATFCPNCGASNTVAQPMYTAAVSSSDWDGGVLDTVINSIIASLIISVTCGIATPWAVCYMMRFILEHTIIDGKRLTFDGTGGQLFGQWIKWFVLTVITCGIYSFWVIPRMYRWIASHTHTQG